MNTLIFGKELYLTDQLKQRMKEYNILYNQKTQFLQLPQNFFFERNPKYVPSQDDNVCYTIHQSFPQYGKGIDIVIGAAHPNKGQMNLIAQTYV